MSSEGWQLDHDAARQAFEVLRSAGCVCFPTHQNVDADGVSSALAMLDGLRRRGGNGFVLISDGRFPRYLSFLPGSEQVVIYGKDELPEYDMLCLVDCSDQRRLGKFYTDEPSRIDGDMPIVNIDHHVTNDRYGVVNIVEPRAAAAAEIVTDILESGGSISMCRWRSSCWPASTETHWDFAPTTPLRARCARPPISSTPAPILLGSSTRSSASNRPRPYASGRALLRESPGRAR